jgi:uncharacterized membrane protein YtjA (UPF0391 family)
LRAEIAITGCTPADAQDGHNATHGRPPARSTMLHYAVIFFVIAIIAAVLGFSGIAGAASNIAWILFVVFLVLAVISMFRKRT